MKAKLITLFSLLFLFGVFVISCDEESILPETPDTQSAEDNSVAEAGVARVFENVNNYGISEEGKKSIMDGPDTVYWSVDGKTVTIDFGADGMIVATFNIEPGPTVQGLSAAVTITNFNVDGTIMDGAFTLTFDPNILDPNEGPTFDIVTTTDIVFTDDTTTSTWGGNRHIEWSEGYLTLNDQTDDVFLISGASHGINTSGVSYTVVIDSEHPLRLDDCEWMSAGIMTITEGTGDDATEMTLNFGDGTCDSLVVVTIGGVDITIDMAN